MASALAVCAMLLPLSAVAGQHHNHTGHASKHQEQRQIEQLELQWRQAALSDDITTMDKLLSDDYLGITAEGELLTKTQQLDRMKSRELTLQSLDVSDEKIKIVGQIAIVTSLAQVEGLSGETPLHGAFRYTRVYQRQPNGSWKVTNFEVTRVPPPGRMHHGPRGANPPPPPPAAG